MHQSPKTFGALTLAGLVALAAFGCKEPEIKQAGRKGRTVKANIATFDPNADLSIDIENNKLGTERPDDYAAQMAFNQAFEPMDECVLAAKERKGMKPHKTLKGDIDIEVKVEGPTGKALGVNATLPGKHDKDDALKECIREAVASVQFPSYDGPPTVITFSTELDAGYMEE